MKRGHGICQWCSCAGWWKSSSRDIPRRMPSFRTRCGGNCRRLEFGSGLRPTRIWRRRRCSMRRNVGQVLRAYEAGPWNLPVVFVCGLVEKQFPRYPAQDAFFPDAVRRQLQAAGIRVRTTADADLEEAALFDAAVACATRSLILSYPKFDGRGEENLPSAFLERFPLPQRASRLVLPRMAPPPAPGPEPGLIAAHD